MTRWEKVNLAIVGYFERDGKTFIECPKHGVTDGYIHGWKEYIGCLKCIKES